MMMPETADEAEQRFYVRYSKAGVTAWPDVQGLLGRNRPQPATVEGWVGLAEDLRERLSAPKTLAGVQADLVAPFEAYQVELKPGATTSDKKRALALAYVDLRAYQERLDEVAGIDGWGVEYRQLGNSLICRLTILGVTKEDVGEPSGGDNPATESLAQSFKRACSAFGLGRYLYSLPKLWFAYDADKKCFADAQGATREIYQKSGLLVERSSRGGR
jgi:hypothetical protein